MRLQPGPTHSVFDVLAALVALARPAGRVGILGFAGGGMMAPLRRLGCSAAVEAVDLDRGSYELFARHCSAWAGPVEWHHGDAVEWLRFQEGRFDVLVEDLSVPHAGDVFKPQISWDVLPKLMGERMSSGGVAILNQIPLASGGWPRSWPGLGKEVGPVVTVRLEDFENRIVVVGQSMGTARALGVRIRACLRELGSRQANRVRVCTGIV